VYDEIRIPEMMLSIMCYVASSVDLLGPTIIPPPVFEPRSTTPLISNQIDASD